MARIGRTIPNKPIVVRNSQLGGVAPPTPVTQLIIKSTAALVNASTW